jgi:tetratricopeptide (TPR) repeat protein
MENHNMEPGDARQTAEAQLEEAKRLFHQGDRAGAEALFKRIIHLAPHFEEAWLWLAYVAPTDARRLSLLREANLFIPGSERIQQAREWALEQYRASGGADAEDWAKAETDPPERRTAAAEPQRKPRQRRQKGRAVASLDEMARDAGQSVRQGWDDAREWTSEAVAGASARLGGFGVYLVSVLGIAAIAFLVFIGVARANKPPIMVTPMVLPTLVVDATPTPTVASRIAQEWIKVEVAGTKSDWNSAVRALDNVLTMEPGDEKAREQLAAALLERGRGYIEQNRLEEAKADLNRAIQANASNAELQRTRNDLDRYMQGMSLYQAQDWQGAIDVFLLVYAKNPEFRDTPALLADCYDQLGKKALGHQDWFEAEKLYANCLVYEPGNQACLDGSKETAAIITPPTRVEVSLTTRMCNVYEDGNVIKTFQVCTGRPSAPTVPGRYTVLSKIPDDAYASKWDLIMPWWIGIYWAGGSENGFHAFPLRGGTQVLWTNALGTGCSFGCIVLDTNDAEWLYNWAELGTVVFVRP